MGQLFLTRLLMNFDMDQLFAMKETMCDASDRTARSEMFVLMNRIQPVDQEEWSKVVLEIGYSHNETTLINDVSWWFNYPLQNVDTVIMMIVDFGNTENIRDNLLSN